MWEALINPELIKQYFFGVDVVTDWKEGSPILYKGEWEGKPFEEKGNVIKVEHEKCLVTNYWTPTFDLPDSLENYSTITYELASEGGGTKLSIIQENVRSEKAKDDSEKNWNVVLDGLKKLLEK